MLVPSLRTLPSASCVVIALAICTVAFGDDKVTADKSFTVVLLPDTQFYSEAYPETYIVQTLWIRQQKKRDNIKFVIHLGDIVQTVTKKPEWENADLAMRLLDGVVPYSIVPGNHDINLRNRDSTMYNNFFSPARFSGRQWYGGHMGEANDNNYCFFEAAGMKFMVLSLEFAPREETLQWAASIAQRYSDRRVILATHCYMRPTGRDTSCGSDYTSDGNGGEQIWQKLVRKQPNIFLVVSGHVLGTAQQTSINDSGGKVVELLTDYQGLPNGGDGWLRSLKFVPSEEKIYVSTYSPLLDKESKETNKTFVLDYEMSAIEQELDSSTSVPDPGTTKPTGESSDEGS